MNKKDKNDIKRKKIIRIVDLVAILFLVAVFFIVRGSVIKKQQANPYNNVKSEISTEENLKRQKDRLVELNTGKESERPLILIIQNEDVLNENKETLDSLIRLSQDKVDVVAINKEEEENLDSFLESQASTVQIFDKRNQLPLDDLSKLSELGFYILHVEGEDIAIQTNNILSLDQYKTVVRTLSR